MAVGRSPPSIAKIEGRVQVAAVTACSNNTPVEASLRRCGMTGSASTRRVSMTTRSTLSPGAPAPAITSCGLPQKAAVACCAGGAAPVAAPAVEPVDEDADDEDAESMVVAKLTWRADASGT